MAGNADALGALRRQHGHRGTNVEERAYELAQRALDQQETALEDLRTRTATLLTATALVVSFLGARTLDGASNRSLALIGLAFAVACVVLCVSILAPRRNIAARCPELPRTRTSSQPGPP